MLQCGICADNGDLFAPVQGTVTGGAIASAYSAPKSVHFAPTLHARSKRLLRKMRQIDTDLDRISKLSCSNRKIDYNKEYRNPCDLPFQ